MNTPEIIYLCALVMLLMVWGIKHYIYKSLRRKPSIYSLIAEGLITVSMETDFDGRLLELHIDARKFNGKIWCYHEEETGLVVIGHWDGDTDEILVVNKKVLARSNNNL